MHVSTSQYIDRILYALVGAPGDPESYAVITLASRDNDALLQVQCDETDLSELASVCRQARRELRGGPPVGRPSNPGQVGAP